MHWREKVNLSPRELLAALEDEKATCKHGRTYVAFDGAHTLIVCANCGHVLGVA